jgi:hypothetical protein
MITTLDNRFKLPSFEVLKNAVGKVMKGQTALTFEGLRSTNPVTKYYQREGNLFWEGNEVMKKIKSDRKPKQEATAPKPEVAVDKISKMLKAFKQKIDQKLSTAPQALPSNRGPLVCYYCHREGHRTARCFELQKDKDDKLVEQRRNNFFLPNRALIPFDTS